MGVPGLFSFLRRRYPSIVRATEKRRDVTSDGEVDNLYVDMNHIIHSCTHAHVAKDRVSPLSEAEMFAGMAAYLEALLDLLEPRRVVLIAVDGVAPRAKMNQQRTRRFLSAYISGITDRIEAEVRREMVSEAGGGLELPVVKRFDSNIITPGTDFMLLLAAWLRRWAQDKAANDARFRHTAFIISDASEPGEGEHKIMKFIRFLRCQPGYDPASRHVVYGQDADLLLLTLVTHEPHFRVMRENNDADAAAAAKPKDASDAEQQLRPLSAVAAALQQQAASAARLAPASAVAAAGGPQGSSDHLHMPRFETVDISVLRECLRWEFSELVGPPGPPGTYGSDESSSGASDDDDQASSGGSESDDEASGDEGGAGAAAQAPTEDSSDDLTQLLQGLTAPSTQQAAGELPPSSAPADAPAAASQASKAQGKQARPAAGDGSRVVAAAGGDAAIVAAGGRVARSRGRPGLSFESLLDDLVVLSFLAGNDFLPNVPSIDMYDKPCGVDLLFSAYKALLPKMGGHIAAGGGLNRGRLVQLLMFLARDEEAAYKRRAEYRRRRQQQQRDEQAAAEESFWSLFDGGLSMGELPPGIDIDKLLAGQAPEMAEALGLSSDAFGARPLAIDLASLSPGELCAELASRVALRVKDRLMAGDPWAQDPVGMDVPGYRQRYYEARFPELFAECDGDIDKVAARVAVDYVDGMCWVLRYYTCGPAALDWLQHQQQPAAVAAAAASAKGGSGGGGGDVPGASWTWCYPHHYAPLMQDLAKVKLGARAGGGSRAGITAGPVPLHRGLDDPAACQLAEWAPPGGPVRPLLQLMCVLPAKSVAEALPAPLANVIVLAESMEADADTSTRAQLRRQQQQSRQQQQQSRSKHGRKAARRAQRAAVAARVEGLSGLDVLAALGEEASLMGSDGEQQQHEEEEDDEEQEQQQDTEEAVSDELVDAAAAAAAAAATVLAGFEMSGDGDVDLMRLAQELCDAFPTDVERLVDLTGKRWLHTGIVRLPMAMPLQVAAVLQAVLVLQQQGCLTATEQLRNTFRPSEVVSTTAAAQAAGAAAEGAAVDAGGSSSSSAADDRVWGLFTRSAPEEPASSSAVEASSKSNGTVGVASAAAGGRSAAAAAVPAMPALGALGLLLSHRRALHTIPSNTLQQLTHQAAPCAPVWQGQLDLAGLPVPQHSCCLLPGGDPLRLSVSSSAWRHISAGFTSAAGYADKVLGIRSAASEASGSRGGRGCGPHTARGGRDGGGGGRGAGSRGGRGFQQQQQQMQQQQYYGTQQQTQQPYLDPAYYYNPADDYSYSSGSSHQPSYGRGGGRGRGGGSSRGGGSGRCGASSGRGSNASRYQY